MYPANPAIPDTGDKVWGEEARNQSSFLAAARKQRENERKPWADEKLTPSCRAGRVLSRWLCTPENNVTLEARGKGIEARRKLDN
ncbi:hypothetical protein KM043_010318 [Ampulex compressa]|nr:hypothetical protein KM043_010318 [Ampulex compressa]